MKPIRVVQYGGWFYTHAEHTMLTMRSLPQYYDVVGFCEPNCERLEIIKNKEAYKDLKIYSVEELLCDKTIDAVIVETEETNQAADSLMFMRAGFNVHSDKPCGGSVEDFAELMKTATKNGKVFQNGYMFRYNPAILRALEIARSGELGELIAVEAQMSQCYHGDMLEMLEKQPGGMMFYLGCHLADAVYSFMGEPLEVLPFNTASGLENPNAKDFGLALLKYKHGYSMIKTVACEVSGDARRQLVISGTKGTIEIKPIENPVQKAGTVCPNKIFMSVTKTGHSSDFGSRAQITEFPVFGRYDDMMIDFAKTVAGEKENEFDYERELEVYKLITELCK